LSVSAQQSAAQDSRPARPRGTAQRRFGNRRTQAIIQAKLNVGPVDDPYLAIGAIHLVGRRDITETTRWVTRRMHRAFDLPHLNHT
jgi:hypothetical protein